MAAVKKASIGKGPMPVDAFEPNPFGLYQVHGNVNEWVDDCWRNAYQQTAATDGTAASHRRLRSPGLARRILVRRRAALRSAARCGFYPGYRANKIGFRVARSL